MKSKIILLEILDKELKIFLDDFYSKYQLKKNSFPHITLRGPFKSNISNTVMHQIYNYVNKVKSGKEIISIHGVGIFHNDDKYIVHLKVEPFGTLRKLSYKRDYPIKKYGFNPHITLLTTKNYELAMKIKDNLENKNISFKCNNIECHKYDLKNKNMFLLEWQQSNKTYQRIA